MKVYLDPKKNYYKANLHCHTRYSDGRASRETVKEEYKKRGYSAVAFTDHEHLINSKDLSDEDFIAITGVEMSIQGPKVETCTPNPYLKYIHVNLYAKDPDCDLTHFYTEKTDFYKFDDVRHLVKPGEHFEKEHTAEAINEMVRRAHELGFLVSYNHPGWCLHTAEDYLHYDEFDFVEVHNTGCVILGYGSDEQVFSDMMRAGKKIYCTATDDNHNAYGFDPPLTDSFGGWVMIAADKLGYRELMDSLESGDFYASTGPELYSITLDDSGEEGAIKVKCSPAKAVYLITQGRRTGRAIAPIGDTVEEATFKLYPRDARFRIRVDDADGHSAYSQIYDIPEDTPRVLPK